MIDLILQEQSSSNPKIRVDGRGAIRTCNILDHAVTRNCMMLYDVIVPSPWYYLLF